ncbi:Co2+/Mg2+ efflux protein ApaG [Kordiimonas pumila]|uniref:Protein ApaG n=1 Tax=Kordiimonas pumila TaxID=2161677 RepID=A0ABV7D9X1_9PROT|nr:Co2+/Mg2+ efflux protein ApaG [Kordiimonas pumila]
MINHEETLMDGVLTFSDVTDGIRVSVQSYFLEGQSTPENGQFIWAYRIQIDNESTQTVRLLRRHWIITEGDGRVKEVTGDGVIGEQPHIEPGGRYIYTSGSPLGQPSGFMKGSYIMEDMNGQEFSVKIPTFSLDSPYSSRRIN